MAGPERAVQPRPPDGSSHAWFAGFRRALWATHHLTRFRPRVVWWPFQPQLLKRSHRSLPFAIDRIWAAGDTENDGVVRNGETLPQGSSSNLRIEGRAGQWPRCYLQSFWPRQSHERRHDKRLHASMALHGRAQRPAKSDLVDLGSLVVPRPAPVSPSPQRQGQSTTSAGTLQNSLRVNIPLPAIPRSRAGFSGYWLRWM